MKKIIIKKLQVKIIKQKKILTQEILHLKLIKLSIIKVLEVVKTIQKIVDNNNKEHSNLLSLPKKFLRILMIIPNMIMISLRKFIKMQPIKQIRLINKLALVYSQKVNQIKLKRVLNHNKINMKYNFFL